MREAVRSGRRANFFITENRFIDCYAAKVGGSGVAVYSVLQRCANSETRETFISAQKMADVLAMDKSTVYRHLKQLEDLQLIKSLRTREKTIYVVLPVPAPRPEAASTPLFDAIDSEGAHHDTWRPVATERMSPVSETESPSRNAVIASVPHVVASERRVSGTRENRNKEEQDFSNKTQEQDLFNKIHEQKIPHNIKAAKDILRALRLPDTSMSAALAAVGEMEKRTKLSMDGIVQEITDAANHAERRGIEPYEFLDDFLAERLARQMLKDLALPATTNLTSIITAAVKAEVAYTGLSVEKAADLITNAAVEDRRRGTNIDRFYFENARWRSNVRVSKAEQRKLDNLEVNARVKQRIRERLGAS